MRTRIARFAAALALLPLASDCNPPPSGPTAEEVAAALGLVDGRVLHYSVERGSSSSEDHTIQRSSSYAQRVVFTRSEKNQGFQRVDADGTSAVTDIEATETGIQMIARGDCLPRCGSYDPAVAMLPYPLLSGARLETDSTWTLREGDQASTVQERHVFIVGSEGSVDTPAGSQQAFEIAWQRFVDGGAMESATLYWSLDLGLVGLNRFDGSELRLSSYE